MPDSSPESRTFRLERIEHGDGAALDELFVAHRVHFDRSLEEHPSFQGLHRDEFDAIVSRPTSFSLVVRDGDAIVGHCVVCRDLDALGWVSPAYFRRHFAAEVERGALFFVAAMGTEEESPQRVLNAMIDALAIEIAEQDGRVVADFRDVHDPRFPRYIAGRSEMHTTVSWDLLATQGYHSFKFEGVDPFGTERREALLAHREPAG